MFALSEGAVVARHWKPAAEGRRGRPLDLYRPNRQIIDTALVNTRPPVALKRAHM